MSTFALIHGAYGRGALWDPLVRELEARGHRAVAPDLPIEDPSAGFADYADVVEAALDGDPAAVVVGHSLGGVTAALVAERRPRARVVYLAAVLPDPLRPLSDVLRSEPVLLPALATAEARGPGPGRRHLLPDRAAEVLFADVADGTAPDLVGLLRAQSLAPFFERCPLRALPAGPYVVCREDRVVSPDWGRQASRARLGASALEIGGGHHPQLTRPAELAELLGA